MFPRTKITAVILAAITWGVTYHFMYELTDSFWTDDYYCARNAPYQFNTCTKSVAVAGYLHIILPLGLAVGVYAIVLKHKKNEVVLEV